MNKLNEHEIKQDGLKESVAKKVGMQLGKMAVDPRGCWIFSAFEPEIPPEVIAEMMKN